jgi:predicted Rossmann fold nucleotide-binding protein DprA/Smf involved in DNA uptake
MKLGVVGSRENIERGKVYAILDDFRAKHEIDMIVSGGADGVDTFAEDWAKKNRMSRMILCPKWKKFGKPATAIRNQIIVNESDELMIFWDGKSPGTAMTLKMVEKAKKVFHLHIGGKNLQATLDLLEKE